jgi:hypothetical protein
MKKKVTYTLLILLTLIAINSCERDDICIDAITPHLIIRFYNNDIQTNFKNANLLSLKIFGVDNDSITLSATDSIAIPVKSTDDLTKYILTISNTDGSINRDTFSLTYQREDIFVGRSCGFKTIFTSTNYTLQTGSENWIRSISPVTQTIKDETAAHVKIFH